MFRIAIVGSHSTGKSTLQKDLSDALRERGWNCRVGMEVKEIVGARMTSRDPLQFGLALIAEHFRRLEPDDSHILLLDRSLLDLSVYSRHDNIGGKHVSDLIDALMASYLTRLDILIFLPIEFPLVQDGHRPPSEAYRAKIDKDLREVMAAYHVTPLELKGTPEVRLARAVAEITRRLGQRP